MVYSSNSWLCEQYQETHLAFYVGYMIYTKVKPAPFSSSVKAAITLALGEKFNTEWNPLVFINRFLATVLLLK